MNISDSIAVVTGGASGLGLATVRELAAAGAHVVVLDLPGQEAAFAAANVTGSTTFCGADVADSDQVTAAMVLAAGLGPLRILVNCAGIAPAGKVVGRAGALPLADFERAIHINLVGTFNVLRLFAEQAAATDPVAGERGVIVNTASVAAFDGQIGQAAYAASKGGVAAMTLPLARDLAATLVRVNTIAPGIFETPMMAGFTDDVRASLGSQVPHPSRLGRPEEFARLVRHIVENSYLNGETIRLDGAIRMGPR